MNGHIIQWTAPSPLWNELIARDTTARAEEFGIPAILRFATDDFMQTYLDTLATDPRKLGEFRVVPETWRGRLGQPAVAARAPSFALPFQRRGSRFRRTASTGAKTKPSADASSLPRLKLYQPAHQRFYLLSACLVCESPGLPDRRVNAEREERISFVIRRLFPPPGGTVDARQWDEYAWVKTPEGHLWVKVLADDRAREEVVLADEERLPLFPTVFQEDDLRSRRLVSGLIPVGKREAYLGAQRRSTAQPSPPSATTKKTARKILLRKEVIEPWKTLVAQARVVQATVDEVTTDPLPDDRKADARRASREQIQVGSWLVLLDLAQFLKTHIPALWNAVLAGSRPGVSGDPLAIAYEILEGATCRDPVRTAVRHHPSDSSNVIYLDANFPSSLREALARFGQAPDQLNESLKDKLENVSEPYDRSDAAKRALWPDFVFPLADPQFPGDAPLAADIAAITLDPEEASELAAAPADPLDELAVALVRAMPETSAGPEPEIPTAAQAPADQLQGVFRIRCVYERPGCGPLHDDVVSDPTEPFELAGFFDPDAPARPIRIGLPLDTTPAGLRKFDKNTAFAISDVLCGQLKRVKSLGFGDLVRSVLPWPLHKALSVRDAGPCKADGISIGTICSLSIPIITICAFILLIIMVSLLDIIFRWLPYFILCFPVPGLKAKK
jgi:hypothetical protein